LNKNQEMFVNKWEMVYINGTLCGVFFMSCHDIGFKAGAFLVLVIMFLPCVHIVCMEPLDNSSPSALRTIMGKLEKSKSKWEQRHATHKAQIMAEAVATLNYIEDGIDFSESLGIVLRKQHEENSVVSPAIREKMRAYTQASMEFGILGVVKAGLTHQ
jgi:hypothetical protein